MPTFSGGGGGILTVSKTLTNAEILSLPTTPVVLIPATQTLNYSGTPASLPIPVTALVSCPAATANYTNADATFVFRLVWGSDYSLDVAAILNATLNGERVPSAYPVVGVTELNVFSSPNLGLAQQSSGTFFDNALALAAKNGALGNLTGGNAANTLRVTVAYFVATL